MPDPLFFDDVNQKSESSKSTPTRLFFKFSIFTIAIGIIGYSVWFFYPKTNETSALPVIRADINNVRVKPQQEGGMDIANQDSTIYNTFEPESGATLQQKKVENLLDTNSSTEAPISKEALFAGLKPEITDTEYTPTSNQNDTHDTMEDIEITETFKQTPTEEGREEQADPLKTPAPKTDTPSADTSNKASKPTKKLALAQPKAIVAKQPTNTPPPQQNGSYYVQLASIQDKSKTAKAWSDLQDKYGSLLNSVNYRTQEINIADKGIFYRIQGGPLTKEQAEKLCNDLKNNNGSCFVVQK